MTNTWPRVLVIGAVLGIVAAAVVWYLERFEVRKMIGEAERVLSRHADFEKWLRERRAAGGDASA